jgi:hypothetical protein
MKDASLPRVVVVGAGAFAQGLCAQAVRAGATFRCSLSMASRKVGVRYGCSCVGLGAACRTALPRARRTWHHASAWPHRPQVQPEQPRRIPGLPDTPVVDMKSGLALADIVILALPCSSHARPLCGRVGHAARGQGA